MMQNFQLLPIAYTLSLAWEKTKGVKKSIWAAVGVIILIFILLSICFSVLAVLFVEESAKAEHPLKLTFGTISNLVGFLFQMGLLFIGIKRASNLAVNYRMVFAAFNFATAVKLLGYYILQFLILFLIFIPFLVISILLNTVTADISKDFLLGLILIASSLFALYVFIRMYLTPGFILDKRVNPWQAIKLSFFATRENFLRLLIINILEFLFVLISMIPLGIGLIWSFPFVIVCYGVIYKILVVNAFPTEASLQ